MKYPLLLVHGMGFRDYKHVGYWGRIPKALEKLGCLVYFGGQDSNGSTETNAQHLARRINEILAQTGAEKVNILAHSKGGMDSRYAISSLKMGDKVASLTTMSTPHHGSKTVDKLLDFPDWMVRFVGWCADVWFRVLGDREPSTYRVFHSFTTTGAEEFNKNNPDWPGVYYQSYAFVMKKPSSDLLMWLPYVVVKGVEGPNDGLLTPEAVQWGEFRGVFAGAGRRGISHCDEIDLRRRPLCKKEGDGVSDIVKLYQQAVERLIEMGY